MDDQHDTSAPDSLGEMAIAIVGLSVRVPGARDARRFWTWIDSCSAARIEIVPGDHMTMMLPPHVEGLAARIRSFLERSHVD